MIDIDEMTRALLERPSLELHYSKSQGKFIGKITREEEDDPDICFFMGCGACFFEAKKIFRAKHLALFPKAPSSYSLKKWNEIVKENGLEEEWFQEFRLSLAEDTNCFALRYGLRQVEAEASLYQEIRKELLTFEAKHYEKKYSDQVLFILPTNYEDIPMTILGNAGNVFGVSFYPSDPNGLNYELIENHDALGIDDETANSLIKMVSFYFENDKNDVCEITDNPLGKDNHLTSCCLMNGTIMSSYLPKSIAILALHFLKCANKYMEIFENSPSSKDILDDHFHYVMFHKGVPAVSKAKSHVPFHGVLPYDFREISFRETPLSFSPNKSEAWDATIRLLPGGFFSDDFGEGRCAHFGFTAIFCDHKSGYIYAHAMGEAKDFMPFDELCNRLMDSLADIKVPKTIYVNNFLDFAFFDNFFAPYIDNKKMKLVPMEKRLQTDNAYESLSYFLNQKMEEDNRKRMKNNRS